MRISDWSSDVCSSDLPSRNNSYGAAHVLAQPKRDGLGVFACRIYGSWVCLSSGGLFPKRSGSRKGIAAFAQNGCKDASEFALPCFVADKILPHFDAQIGNRSKERREGKEGVSTCRSRWSPYH